MSLREKYGMSDTAVIVLKDANDEPMLGDDEKPWTITVYAPGTKQHNKAMARATNVQVDRFQAKGKPKITGDEWATDKTEYAVLVTKCVSENLMREFPGLEGADLFRAIYKDDDIGYLACERVQAEQKKNENFSKRSPVV